MKLFRKMNNCKKSALLFINKALLVVASIFLGVNITLKTCAMPAPVIPEGLTPQVIEGTPATQSDQSNMYLTLLYALGLEISQFPSTQGDSVFRDGLNQADVDSIVEAFNELNVQDPTLGDDLKQFMNVQSLIYSQNGQVKEFELPRELWVRMNKATSNGLNLKIQSNSSIPFSDLDSFKTYMSGFGVDTSVNGISRFYNRFVSNGSFFACSYTNNSSGTRTSYLFLTGATASFDLTQTSGVNIVLSPISGQQFYFIHLNQYGDTTYGDNSNSLNLFAYDYSILNSFGNVINKHIPVALDFISNKANENYDLINKSSSIDPQTGKITGPVTIASLSASQLQQLQDLINNGFLTLAEAMNRLGIAPYNDSTGILIDSNIDPAAMQQSLAQASSPAPTEPHLSSALEDIDEWNPQSIVPDLPLSGVMNWVAVQMNILMNISQFQNIWLVISTLAVCVLLIGVARLWK